MIMSEKVDVTKLISDIENLQKQTNEASVKKETAINGEKSIQKDIEELEEKSKSEFGCSLDELPKKEEEYSKEVMENINRLKKILGY